MDLIEDEKSGIRVPPQDPLVLATALHQVLTAPDFATELGRNARATIQHKFDSDTSIETLEGIYQGLLER